MREATYDDAVAISHYFEGDAKKVWEIIRVMKFTSYSALKIAVHMALLERSRRELEHIHPAGHHGAYSGH